MSITVLLMIRPRPMVSRIWFCASASSTRLMNTFWRKPPNRNIRGNVISTDTKGSIPRSVKIM